MTVAIVVLLAVVVIVGIAFCFRPSRNWIATRGAGTASRRPNGISKPGRPPSK